MLDIIIQFCHFPQLQNNSFCHNNQWLDRALTYTNYFSDNYPNCFPAQFNLDAKQHNFHIVQMRKLSLQQWLVSFHMAGV